MDHKREHRTPPTSKGHGIGSTTTFHNKMITDSDSECSYVANLAGFSIIRVIIIVVVIKIIVINP